MKKYKTLLESYFDIQYPFASKYGKIYAIITLPDKGKVTIIIEKPTRKIKFWFVAFNIRFSNLRLTESAKNGKIKLFMNTDPYYKLESFLVELKELVNNQ